MRQFQCVPTTYVTENKETMFKFTLKPSSMSIVFAPFKHLKLPISITIPVTHYTTNCLYLEDSYISEIDYMNYLFANLVVAWLYLYFAARIGNAYQNYMCLLNYKFSELLSLSVHLIIGLNFCFEMVLNEKSFDSRDNKIMAFINTFNHADFPQFYRSLD